VLVGDPGRASIGQGSAVTGLDDDALIAFLTSHGADRIEHPGGTLLAHLRRTAERLAAWGARPALIAAGLTHAAYGTDGFRVALIEPADRALLSELIGAEAEAIVYAYGSCDRSFADGLEETQKDRFTGALETTTDAMSRDLADLTGANEIDVLLECESLSPQDQSEIVKLLRRCAVRGSPAAARAIETFLDCSDFNRA
jgi:hypothetical protein